MNTPAQTLLADELADLIESLHVSERRLQELTGGQIDSIIDHDGRSWMLRRAQDEARIDESARQAAILDALPANIALIDASGMIQSVNEAWRQFAQANAGDYSSIGVGVNYLTTCDEVSGVEAPTAKHVAEGIRAVLSGASCRFSLEYPCDSPGTERWFQMLVTPVAGNPPSGAVIMHLNSTEHKLVEQALSESELRFRQLADNIPDVFYLRDTENNQILYASPAFEEIWGLSRAKLYADPKLIISSIHIDDREQMAEKLAQGNRTGDFSIEYRIVRPDGALRWISSVGFPVHNESGALVRIAGVARDITERKRAEAELSESERRFSDLLGNVQLLSVMLELDGRINFCNDYLLQLTGWRMDEVLGRSWFDLFVPQPHDAIKDSFKQLLLNAPDTWHHENKICTRTGELRLIRWSNSVLRSADGGVNGTASIGEDITEHHHAEQALVELRRHNDVILAAVGDGIYSIDIEGNIILANPAAEHLLGYPANGLAGKPEHSTIHHSRADHTEYSITACPVQLTMIDGIARRIEDEVLWRADGSKFFVEYSTAPIRNNANELIGAVVAFRDISERKESAARILYLNRVYAMLSGINTLIVRVRDKAELFFEACRVSVEAGGFRMAMIGIVDARANNIKVAAAVGIDDRLMSEIALILSGDRRENSMAITALQNKIPVISNDSCNDPRVLLAPHYTEAGVRSLAVFPLIVADVGVGFFALYASEIDFFKEEEIKLLMELSGDVAFAIEHLDRSQQLHYLAYYDVLTGLPNAELFKNRLGKYVSAARQDDSGVCLCVIDLEHFAQINDNYGRSVGDEVLRAVAERFRQVLVEPVALGRISADTYAAAIPSDHASIPTSLRDSIHQALELPLSIAGREIKVAARIGIALYPADGDNAEALYRNGEAALKLARNSGDRSTYFSHELNAQIAQRYALELQLRTAVAEQQFVLHYQPRVDMISGELVGAEALIRWQHPQRGLVGPSDFIALTEETGLIVPLGAWVLEQACAQQARWLAAGIGIVPIAVNLSSVQFETGDLVQTVGKALAAHGLASKWLVLELTESAVMNDSDRAAVTLQTLRKLGVGLALDDFGTGYSSLAHLKRFPFDSVKIDRSFVTDVTRNPNDAAIAGAIIAMAHGLKLKVVAEGIETQGQFNFLRTLGCDEMQGFLFGAAVPSEEFEAQLRSRRRLNIPEPTSADERTLLIVDDEPGIRAALTRMLRPDGYRILHASGGQAALDMLAVNQVQVIICDQRMPGMTGTEFLGTAAELYPNIVRMILSGFTDLNIVTDAVNRGAAFKFLTKPWDDNQLREHVRDAFRRYRQTVPVSSH